MKETTRAMFWHRWRTLVMASVLTVVNVVIFGVHGADGNAHAQPADSTVTTPPLVKQSDQPANDGNNRTTMKAQLNLLVDKLNDSNFDTRQAAARNLEDYIRTYGQDAFDLLEKDVGMSARASRDPEIAARLAEVRKLLTSPHINWGQRTGALMGITLAPIIADGFVIQSTMDGLHVLNAVTGQKLWSKPGNYSAQQGFYKDGRFYTGTPSATFEPQRLGIEVFNIKDGSSVLNETLDSLKLFTIQLDSTNDHLIVSGRSHEESRILALDLNGKRQWVAGDSGTYLTDPAVTMERDAVICIEGHEGDAATAVVALDLKTGRRLWRKEFPGSDLNYLTLAHDRVLVVSQFGDDSTPAELINLDLKDGSLLWRCDPNAKLSTNVAAETPRLSSTATTNGTVEFGQYGGAEMNRVVVGVPLLSADGTRVITRNRVSVIGIDAASGKILWQLSSNRSVKCSFAQKDNSVFAGTDDGELQAIRTKDGFLEWSMNLNREPAAQEAKILTRQPAQKIEVGAIGDPTIVNDTLYSTTSSGWTFSILLPKFKR